MISPFVRRQRLGQEIIKLREAAGFTHDQLAKLADGVTRQKLSRLENGHTRPDIAMLMKVLEVFKVSPTSSKWRDLIRVAQQASERGWWESFGNAMGERQQMRANLEAGAEEIREFLTFIPGLVQTEDFVRGRADSYYGVSLPPTYDLDRAVAARKTRQNMLHRPDGPRYEVILDEVALTRAAVPPPVMAAQLRHIVELAEQQSRVSVRVLRSHQSLRDYWTPRSQFSVYTYPDPDDPTVVCVDTEMQDLVHTTPEPVAPYVQLYDRLREAALSDEDSVAVIAKAVDQFT